MKAKTPNRPVRLAAAAFIIAAGGTTHSQEPPGDPPDSAAREELQERVFQAPDPDKHYEMGPGDEDYPDGLGPIDRNPPDYDTSPTAAREPELPETSESPEARLQRYFMLYKEALDNKAYTEADTLAKQVVELSIEVFGVDSLDSARALTNLGIAQHQNEDYDSAILNYSAAIEIIERVEDRLNANLINPLKGLGAAQLASGQPDKAIGSFQRAVHVSHVNEGPHNLEQVDVLESLAETYLSVGEFDEVKDIQENIFSLQARDIELDSLEAIPALERQARWQHRLQQFEQERYTWRKIIDIIEDRRGKEDLSLIDPLTDLGKSYLFIGQPSMSFHQPTSISSGEIYLKRALRIAEGNPEATWETREEAMLALGDFYTLSGKPSRARRIYSETWDLLSSEDDRLDNRRDHLETLVVLQDVKPPKYVGIDGQVRSNLPGDNYRTGTIVYDYSVSARGLTTDIAMIEADPAGFDDMERAVLSNLRAMIHRPRLVDGSAVRTDDLTFTHKFFYRESDLPAAEQDGDLAATN
jgi:tetratricopeptide (TPR) repeat protein